MSNFTFAHNVFDAICILKSFNNHISVVVCNFFEIGTVSKWRIREWVKSYPAKCFTPLPDDKILVLSKLKAIIRNNININLKMKSVHSRVEKKMEKMLVTCAVSFSQNVSKRLFPSLCHERLMEELTNFINKKTAF